MSAQIRRFHPMLFKLKSAFLRILCIWFAANLGAVLGRHMFFWAFNSVDVVLNSYASIDWQKWVAQSLNPRAAEFALESAMMTYGSPWLYLVILGGLTACLVCLLGRKWKWLYIAVLISFAALVFVTGLAWKV